MKFLALVMPLVALVAGSHPHAPALIPYVVNPGGIGGIYKGPDSATIIKGPDGAVIKSKQLGGSVAIDDLPVLRTTVSQGPILHAHGGHAGSIHAGPVSAGAIHAGASSAGYIHTDGASAGSIHAGPVSSGAIYDDSVGSAHITDGLIHRGLNDGLVHTGLGAVANIQDYGALDIGHVYTGGLSAGSTSVGPSSGGSILAGPASAGSINAAPVSAGAIHVAPSSAGSIHAGPSSAGSIHVGPSSPGVIHTGAPGLVHAGPSVVLTNDPIVIPDVVVATHDPKIVQEHVIVGHNVISVPKKIEEDSDLVGPSGTISIRGGDAVISGPSSTTIKGGGVVTDVKKQDDLQVKTVEVKPIAGAAIIPAGPALHPAVESTGTILTNARPFLPGGAVYAAGAPVLPLHPIVNPIGHSHAVVRTGQVLANPLPLGLSELHGLPHYAPAYGKHPHY